VGDGVRRVLITTSRTEERLTHDGVVITNGFTGQQGWEVARVFARRGEEVTLVTGPTPLPDIEGVRTIHVVSMQDMQAAVMKELETPIDIYVSVAAIADFSVAESLSVQLKPGEPLRLEMQENPSLVGMVARHPVHRPKIVVSFAAQSPETVLEYAAQKFAKLGVDMTVANPIGTGADPSRNQVYFIYRKGAETITEKLDEMPKADVAERIVGRIELLSCIFNLPPRRRPGSGAR
jgi:phosphopantothenoylcysteine decarboxylase/phosphopantothenate--cysteine ligase